MGILSVGQLSAENDIPQMYETYYVTDDFEAISSESDRRCFLVGARGTGKSAAFLQLQRLRPEHVLLMDFSDLVGHSTGGVRTSTESPRSE